jgi:Ca2+-binding EF-hand superfamily protein
MIVLTRDVFAAMLELEGSLEHHRRELAHRRDFSLQGAFNFFANST